MWWQDGWGGGWFFMPLIGLAFWAAVIWIVVSLVRSRPTPPPVRDARSAAGPEEILAQRYARGEIDDDEYRRRLDTLRGVRHHEGRP